MPEQQIEFKVVIKYSTEEDVPDGINHTDIEERLFEALENERQQGCLSPEDYCTDWVTVNAVSMGKSKVEMKGS